MQRILVVTDVSEQPIGPIFEGQAFFFECCTAEDGKVTTHTLRKIPEEWISQRKSIRIS
jgi:hypothetical protein